MFVNIPIEWLRQWAVITDQEELMETLLEDWHTDCKKQNPYWFSKDTQEGNVIFREYNIENQFDGKSRRHYTIRVTTEDYDPTGENSTWNVVFKKFVHLSASELIEMCKHLVKNYAQDHFAVHAVVTPEQFEVCNSWQTTDKGTTVSEDGQIGFKL